MSYPAFYNPQNVGTIFPPRVGIVTSTGVQAGIPSADQDEKRVLLLLVDTQIDFVHEDGSLNVPGAVDDTRRCLRAGLIPGNRDQHGAERERRSLEELCPKHFLVPRRFLEHRDTPSCRDPWTGPGRRCRASGPSRWHGWCPNTGRLRCPRAADERSSRAVVPIPVGRRPRPSPRARSLPR